MAKPSQKRAVAKNRRRLAERGMSRYEVRGLKTDTPLIRGLAKRLAVGDAAAAKLRIEVSQKIGGHRGRAGGILAALRRSPLVGAELHIARETTTGRDIDL